MSAPINPGDVLGGKYRVERVLGTGGMGVVVAAHHLLLDERVAIKFLHPEAVQSPEVVARFAREARAAAKIHNEHVVRVSDVGTLPNGAAYMVMEYLEGVDLHSEINRRGPLPYEEVIELVLQALEAMAEAHSLGIVHRDLKPANLFLARRRGGSICLKVLDFGISRMSGKLASEAVGETATGSVFGTPLYMAPEQWVSAKHADACSDIWSLGAILYHALAGRPPFLGESIPTLWHAIGNDVPTPLRSLRSDVPSELEAAVTRCLQKKPSDRFRTVGELAVALGPLAPPRARASIERVLALSNPDGGESGAATRDVSIQDEPPAHRTITAYGFGTLRQRSPAKSAKLIVAGGFLLLLVVAGGSWFFASHRASVGAAPVIAISASSVVVTEPAPPVIALPAAPALSVDATSLTDAPERLPEGTSPQHPGHDVPPLARPTSRPASPKPAPLPAVQGRPKKPNADKFE